MSLPYAAHATCAIVRYSKGVIGRKKKSTGSGSLRAEDLDLAQVEQEKKSSEPASSRGSKAIDPKVTPPKGRPTPSRKQQEAARRQPLVPSDRKAAKAEEREAARERRLREQQAMRTGDERYLPLRDKGPQRRYIRDFVDARFNVGDVLIFIMLAVFIAGIFIEPWRALSTLAMWVLIAVWFIDSWLMWRKLKSQLIAKFGEIQTGSGMYAFNRVMMVRPLRMPKPQVKRGEFPR